MRYTVPMSYIEEKAEIEFNNKIYVINDTEENYQRILDLVRNKADSYAIIAAAIGEEAAEEIKSSKPSYKALEMLGVMVFAAIRGADPKEAQEAYFRTKKGNNKK